MSEYQRYEFITLDRRLTEADMDELRECSTRATITPTRFFNEYQWGNFKGDPDEMMDRYFDAFAYWTNWGSREFQLKLPGDALEEDALAPYHVEGGLEWRRVDGALILRFRLDHEPEDGWLEDERVLYTMSALRDDLVRGDLRALYVGWLACTLGYELASDALEPPVPPGLDGLTPALEAMAWFFDVWQGLTAVAAERSPVLPAVDTDATAIAAWVERLPGEAKVAALVRLMMEGESGVKPALLRRFNQDVGAVPAPAEPTRTAEAIHEAARRWEVEEEERRRVRDAVARDRRLDELASREAQAWLEALALIGEKKVASYDRAVPLLKDLRALAERDGRGPQAQARLESMLGRLTRRPALTERLRAAGLL